jgi:2-dehydro-3-deoxygluconokinase
LKIAIIGECMVELSQQSNTAYTMGFGGDTLNTAIYLSRCGGTCEYFTVLGNDPFSQQMLKNWKVEGVGVEYVKINENELPGLYIIENDDDGERYFHYWRQNSPARRLISDYPSVLTELSSYAYIYLSGVTLSLYSEADLHILIDFLTAYRMKGGKVIFDNNYRPRNWKNVDYVKSVFKKMMNKTDIALISFDDEVTLYGQHSLEACLARWEKTPVEELVVKNGHHGCYAVKHNETTFIPLERVVKPVDTTAAGDSFNGAYLASKLTGASIIDCVKAGQICAANVIMHKGAIVDRTVQLMDLPA